MRSNPKPFNYHFGRLAIALSALYLGYNVILQSREVYAPLLMALKCLVIGDNDGSKMCANSNMSSQIDDIFVEPFQYVGAVMMAGAMLIILNLRMLGVPMCLAALACVMATQDNPLIVAYVKTSSAN